MDLVYLNMDTMVYFFTHFFTPGGKKRSAFYYDIWNIRYLSKFNWDDLIGELGTDNYYSVCFFVDILSSCQGHA